MNKIELVELETLEPTAITTVFECTRDGCQLILDWVPMGGCPKCGCTTFQAKCKEVIF